MTTITTIATETVEVDREYSTVKFNFVGEEVVDENDNTYTTWQIVECGQVIIEGEGDYGMKGAVEAAEVACEEYQNEYESAPRFYSEWD